MTQGDLVVDYLLDEIRQLHKQLAIEKSKSSLLAIELQIYKKQLKEEQDESTTEQ